MMNWENLRTFECPHCEKPLGQDDKVIHCTVCLFEMSVDRYRSILMHRAGEDGQPPYRNRWQNLHEDRCVQCGSDLINAIGNYKVLKCSRADCTFRIRGDSIATILADPEHPANRFSSGR